MTPCPKCGSIEQRIHGTLNEVAFVKRWRVFGRLVPRVRARAMELSCYHCNATFRLAANGAVELTPLQTAYEQLQVIRGELKGLAENAARGTGRESSDEDKPLARANVARPAADPRVKRRT